MKKTEKEYKEEVADLIGLLRGNDRLPPQAAVKVLNSIVDEVYRRYIKDKVLDKIERTINILKENKIEKNDASLNLVNHYVNLYDIKLTPTEIGKISDKYKG